MGAQVLDLLETAVRSKAPLPCPDFSQANMARRCSSSLAVATLCTLAVLGLTSLMMPAFVAAPTTLEKEQHDMPQLERAAALAAAAALVPEAAHAANNGYALQQLFSAIFVIGLGPAVLFWIYFNKPELL